MDKLLKLLADIMQELNINYDFMEWKSTPIPYPYFVGQYFTDDYSAENGTTTGQILLVGWDRGSTYKNLVDIDNLLKKHFAEYTKVLEDGSSVSINYDTSNTDYNEMNLKKIEIRLDFSLWERR